MNDKITHWDNILKAKTSEYERSNPYSAKLITANLLASDNSVLSQAKMLTVLEKIYYKNIRQIAKGDQPTPHKDLMPIVYSPDILRLAFRKLTKNKGASTPGTAGNTASDVSEETIAKLSQELKEGSFKWTPIRRIMIPKPGKAEKRPLGLPDFRDKMVQEAIRLVLEVIYEPLFRKYETNYGFRAKRDCVAAIRDIRQKAQFADFVIEGDIVGAYNNVNHDILLDILKKRIADPKFLKLLRDGFRAGIIEDFKYFDTFLGVPQGGISSPILFNIYMHEFDEFVMDSLRPYLLSTNQIPELPTTEISSAYATLKSKKGRINKKLRELNSNELDTEETTSNNLTTTPKETSFKTKLYIIKLSPESFPNIPFVKDLDNVIAEIEAQELQRKAEGLKASGNVYSKYTSQLRRKLTPEQKVLLKDLEIQYFTKELAKTKSIARQTPYLDIDRKSVDFYYKRYADDWTIWLRGNKGFADYIKEECASYLKDWLKLELSPTKTKITNLTEDKALFLGFEIYFPKNSILRKRSTGGTQRVRAIQIAPDASRLENRFKLKGYLDQKKAMTPREIGWLTVLECHEIVKKFNQFMTGLGNYYIPEINQPGLLNNWHYLLYYSCIKTLATKLKISVKKVINTYGYRDISIPNSTEKKVKATDKRICFKYEVDGQTRWETLLNYKEFSYLIKEYRAKYRDKVNTEEGFNVPPIDFKTLHKANFRTKFKNTTFCTVCGIQAPLQNHHKKPIKHAGGQFTGFKGFDKLVASLGRKQIPVCQGCHKYIHLGTYNGMSLDDLYDVRIATPEGRIVFPQSDTIKIKPTPGNEEETQKQKASPLQTVFIDEDRRTYLNIPYKNSYKNYL